MPETIYSANFYAGGTFNSQDQVVAMTGNGGQPAAPIGGVGIEPWLPVSINIVGVDIVFFQGAQYVNYAFAGNGYSPDIMRWWNQPNEIQSGLAFPFPAAAVPVAAFTGSVDLTVLTVSSVQFGALVNGGPITGPGLPVPTTVNFAGTGSGGDGTYVLSASENLGNTAMVGYAAVPPHIDCHVSGAGGEPFELFYTVFFTKNPT